MTDDPPMTRHPMDLQAYEARAQSGPCFICAFLSGDPDYPHETIYEDEHHIAFLDRWPTLPGKVLVAPKAHLEHVVRDLDEAADAGPGSGGPGRASRGPSWWPVPSSIAGRAEFSPSGD
ncbi:HIT family protein [Streptomyces sp. NBC_01262]|uniref:HIT family protein n=1 Tax=Streptomyces sp. NBC_01262 TaxID=2903803 RepID=UPI002E2F93B2|nr:HIT domain-containing protein [Streptomyces sp. NBC_01262]